MRWDDKRKGRRLGPRGAKPQVPPNTEPPMRTSEDRFEQGDIEMTVQQFAREVADWLVECADEDDIQQSVADFKGVPIEKVIVSWDDIRIIS